MSRPKRIQYKGACYHVSNKTHNNRMLASEDRYKEMFVELLSELHELFEAEIHAWCITDDCYHLLVTTPLANLSKIMRHLNGVYTQKLNRIENTHGTLFKGRYKCVLIDPSSYLLHVSKRIHLTPQEYKLADDLSDYFWSSYQSYVGLCEKPKWLCLDKALRMLDKYGGKYDAFMQSLEDDFVKNFYLKKRLKSIMGNKDFKKDIEKLQVADKSKTDQSKITDILSKRICKEVSEILNIELKNVYESKRGDTNMARLIAIYLHHTFAQYEQNEIAKMFKFKQAGSVGSSLYRYKKLRSSFPEIKEIELLVVNKLKNA